jgi:leucyl-tRNA synthetase
MFMGPFDQTIAWDQRGILGPARFLERVWAISSRPWFFKPKTQENIKRKLHQTIKKVTQDIESLSLNTAISSMMSFVNMASGKISLSDWLKFIQILAPFAPHITEEIWFNFNEKKNKQKSIHISSWPTYDEKLITETDFDLIIQVNGKLRDKISAPKNITKEQAIKLTQNRELVQKWLSGAKPKNIIWVENRLINFII